VLASCFVAAAGVPSSAEPGAPAVVAQADAAARGADGNREDCGRHTAVGSDRDRRGPSNAAATTLPDGSFTLILGPGVYQIAVAHGGFQPTSLNDVIVVAGASQPLRVTLSEENLSSLRTIGRVTTSARGSASSINTGAATSNYVNAQAFTNLANPEMNSVLERIPDVTVQHMGSQQDTSIIVGGLQPYETQVLIDGHPIALGQYGVWLSHLFPSYLIGGVETQSGPGNTTPFANIAVGGTANILTRASRRAPPRSSPPGSTPTPRNTPTSSSPARRIVCSMSLRPEPAV